jgi:hypothetical protein
MRSPAIDKVGRDPGAPEARRAGAASGRQFRDQQRVVKRVDDAGERRAAFMAFEGIALESAGIDEGLVASAEGEVRMTFRAGDGLRAEQRSLLVPVLRCTIMAHRRRPLRAKSRAMNLIGSALKHRLKPISKILLR